MSDSLLPHAARLASDAWIRRCNHDFLDPALIDCAVASPIRRPSELPAEVVGSFERVEVLRYGVGPFELVLGLDGGFVGERGVDRGDLILAAAAAGALYGQPVRYMRRPGLGQPPAEQPRLVRIGAELTAGKPADLSDLLLPADAAEPSQPATERVPTIRTTLPDQLWGQRPNRKTANRAATKNADSFHECDRAHRPSGTFILATRRSSESSSEALRRTAGSRELSSSVRGYCSPRRWNPRRGQSSCGSRLIGGAASGSSEASARARMSGRSASSSSSISRIRSSIGLSCLSSGVMYRLTASSSASVSSVRLSPEAKELGHSLVHS